MTYTKQKIFALCSIVILGLTSCGGNSDSQDISHLDIKSLVSEYSQNLIPNAVASINSHELIVTNANNQKTTYPLPEDEFFISIAPYINQTHPCKIHNLTGCQGELVHTEMELLITEQDGNIIKNEIISTPKNGFIDLWLPRNENFQVTISYDGKTSTQTISTFEGDDTCVTTMQLI